MLPNTTSSHRTFKLKQLQEINCQLIFTCDTACRSKSQPCPLFYFKSHPKKWMKTLWTSSSRSSRAAEKCTVEMLIWWKKVCMWVTVAPTAGCKEIWGKNSALILLLKQCSNLTFTVLTVLRIFEHLYPKPALTFLKSTDSTVAMQTLNRSIF